mmetsp:Transcript_61739/g.172605  ORF Transcript_61739/g.172605 Transcript_61739/m.172605 type:complete len:315 (-) Transcript_61739:175-1119(-)
MGKFGGHEEVQLAEPFQRRASGAEADAAKSPCIDCRTTWLMPQMMLMISPLVSSSSPSRSHISMSFPTISSSTPATRWSSAAVNLPSPSTSNTSKSASTSSLVTSNSWLSARSPFLVSSRTMWNAWNCLAHLRQAATSLSGTFGHNIAARARNESRSSAPHASRRSAKPLARKAVSMDSTRPTLASSTMSLLSSWSRAFSSVARTWTRSVSQSASALAGIVLCVAMSAKTAHNKKDRGLLTTLGSVHGRLLHEDLAGENGSGHNIKSRRILPSAFAALFEPSRSLAPAKAIKDSKTRSSWTGNGARSARSPMHL